MAKWVAVFSVAALASASAGFGGENDLTAGLAQIAFFFSTIAILVSALLTSTPRPDAGLGGRPIASRGEPARPFRTAHCQRR